MALATDVDKQTPISPPSHVSGYAVRAKAHKVGNLALTILEVDDVNQALDDAIEHERPAPYGAVTWTTALLVARYVAELVKPHQRVLDVGVGTGLVACAAASTGAHVVAVDVDPIAVELARTSAELNHLNLETAVFDLTSSALLPAADVVVFADLLYEEDLARAVAQRVLEAVARGSTVVVGDPQRVGRHAFLETLHAGGITAHFLSEKVSPEGEVVQRVGLLEVHP